MLKSEFLKLKRSYIFFPVFLLPLLSAFMGSGNYWMNTEILKDGWYDLWTQYTLFFSFFFYPTMSAVYSAYLCRMETLHNNWKTILSSPISVCSFYITKLIVLLSLMLCSLCFLFFLYGISGNIIFDLPNLFPKEAGLWFLGSIIATIPLATCTLFLSILIKSFTVPIGVAFVGGISGLFFLSKDIPYLNPFSLIPLAMNSNNSNPLSVAEYGILTASACFFTFIFGTLSIILIKRKCR